MVFSWFKKRGGAKPATNAKNKTKNKADKKSGNSVGGVDEPKSNPNTKLDTDANSARTLSEAAASNPLAQAAAPVLEATDADQAQHALAQLRDPQVITYVALQQAKLRDPALALPQMRTEAALHVLEKQSRERNKRINRFARNALERIKSQRREASELRARGEELNSALGKHNNDAATPNLTYAQREAVVVQLQSEYSANAAQYQQLVTELAECEITLEPFPAMVVVKLQPPDPEPAVQLEPTDAESNIASEPEASAEDAGKIAECELLLQTLVELRQPLTKGSPTATPAMFAELMTKLPDLQQRWHDLSPLGNSPELTAASTSIQLELSELEQLANACVVLDELAQEQASAALPARPELTLTDPGGDNVSDKDLSAFSSHQESIAGAAKISKQQLRKLRWPNWAQTNAAISAPFAQRDAIQAEQQWIDEQKQGLSKQLESALDALTESLDNGQAAQSKAQIGQVRRLKQALGKIDPAHNARLSTLNSRLTELVDWQTFATTPKRQELLDAITLIANQPLAPEAQATRVKQLRAQWNELGAVSKAADRRLAERFNAQAQTAFDHCREHFAEQAQQRAANTAQREQICAQLNDYLDAADLTNGDIKAAEQILRTARDAWRQCYPVERKTAKPLEKKFEALQQQLHDRIKAVWTANEEAKQALLLNAQSLAAATDSDLNDRINQAKDLQKRWQQIGPMPRGGERKLWLAFREACDALFNERDGAKQLQQAADQEAIAALTAQVDAFAIQVDQATAADANIEQLRAARKEFNNTQGNMPSTAYNQIKRRFEGLCNTYDDLLKASRRQALHQRIEDLATWDTATTLAGHDAPLPTDADAKLLHGLDAAPAQPPTIESLQRLVLIAEILAEVPSPPADEALRLQVQVERLQQSMGQKAAVDSASGDAQWVELALQWCAQRPKQKGDEVAALQTRYFAALRSALKVS